MYNMQLKKKDRKTVEFNDVVPEETLRIIVGLAVVVGGIYLTGKILRLLGETVHDVRYFVNAVQNK